MDVHRPELSRRTLPRAALDARGVRRASSRAEPPQMTSTVATMRDPHDRVQRMADRRRAPRLTGYPGPSRKGVAHHVALTTSRSPLAVGPSLWSIEWTPAVAPFLNSRGWSNAVRWAAPHPSLTLTGDAPRSASLSIEEDGTRARECFWDVAGGMDLAACRTGPSCPAEPV